MEVVPGPDGLPRCPWALSAPEYLDYHDHEWGRPVTTRQGLYERLTLEAFQSGLSWITILRKREGFRAAFAGFVPEVVATFDEAAVERLMADSRIVRNRLKIRAAISNARVVAAMGEDFTSLVLSFRQPVRPRPAKMADIGSRTSESIALAAALRSTGIRFVGPTTAYALMQAVGLVDDHLEGCFVPTDAAGAVGHP